MNQYDIDCVMNLGLNLSGFCNGDAAKSMPVTREEFDLCKKWEEQHGNHGDLTYWMHVEEEKDE